jgi:Domain of Unknown Function with PDB structure (DUF3857)
MTSEPKAPGAPAIYLYRQADRKDLAAIPPNTTMCGSKFSKKRIPYISANSSISSIRARTVHADGSVLNFDGKVFDKTIEKTKGRMVRAKGFTVPDVQVGSIVEYHFSYDFADGYVFDSYWPVADDQFTKKAVFSLVPYKGFAIRWTWPAGLPAGTEPPKRGPDNAYDGNGCAAISAGRLYAAGKRAEIPRRVYLQRRRL